ncbi:MAG: aminotransferase class III-fold pyridoxal phosphate-dependent enzyme, partial [Deltaproteobacteria bacterium]
MNPYFAAYRQKTPLSETLFKRAREVMPGGVSHNIHYFPPYPFFVKYAKGPKVWDVDGNEIIDLWMGHYTHILGHHADVVAEAIERQVKEGIHWGIIFEKQIEWAELIRELIPCAEMVRFCCSGTEATMYAVRLARAYTGRNTILKIAGGWHGANPDLTLAIKAPYEKRESLGLAPELEQHTKVIPFNDVAAAQEIIRQNRKDLAGIILEPVIGEGGFVPATPEYLKMLRSETGDCGALLILDEVITGFRLSLGGAQKRFGVTPDLTTLGKITGGGLPVGAVAGRKEILEKTSPENRGSKWEKIMIGGGTFSSHPLTVAAGLAMIRYLKDHAGQVYPLLDTKGEMVREGVQTALRRNGIKAAVTGFGSLFQTHFPRQDGVVLNSPHAISQF